MHVLRAEKGYPIIGQETDGTVTPQDLGHGVGRVDEEGLHRPAVAPATRRAAPGPEAAGRPAAGRPGGAAARGRPARRTRRGSRRDAGADARPRHLVVPERGARAHVRAGAGQGRARPDRASACWRRWSTTRSRRRSSIRSCSTRRTCGATGSPPRDGDRVARPFAARRRRAPGAGPRAAVPRPARPAGRPIRRGPDGPTDDGARRPPADRAEHRDRRPTTARATSCGSGPMSGWSSRSPTPAPALEAAVRGGRQGRPRRRRRCVGQPHDAVRQRPARPGAAGVRLLHRPRRTTLRPRAVRPDAARPGRT